MEKGLLEKTGKSLEEWIVIVGKENFEKHGEILKFLKAEHGFTHGYANFVALKSRSADAASHTDEDLIRMQYKGKEHLLPIYEKLREAIQKLDSDITFVPKKANVSARAKKQFALIQPSTKTRIDLGLKLEDKPLTNRLLNSGSFGSMCSNRVQIEKVSEVDEELIGWLKEAYDNAV
ncbi:DUF5655 domain-containing protein [Flagellimonas flava]|uniref:Predicted transport protein n=1 Tax=Flagellimonas flava TaxID=570519 RepID=A0A1M5HK80_9FLAO|nr:DUF5655 domain-containing protein [Allomuricauda flava]SHG16345.1 Predicted transport protein [Allomuricauda flava]